MSWATHHCWCGAAHVACASALVGLLAAQQSPPAARPPHSSAPPTVRVSWRPQRPVPGTLIELAVRPTSARDSGATLGGTLAGEPLHFRWDGRGAFRAVAGIPIDSTDTVSVPLVLARDAALDSAPFAAAAVESVTVRIPLGAVAYPTEQLRVAPQFGREPDSALAARLEAEAARALDVSRGAHATPRLWRGSFLRPRPGRVTSGFGRRREFNGSLQSRHMGVDFAGATGTPVRAANRGVVALVDAFYLGGNVVYLDHGAGLVTAYFHLSRTNVAPGDTVVRGQIIGRVGATGRVTGPHLHWIARYGTVTVDPLSLLTLGPFLPSRPPTGRATRRTQQ